MHTLPSEISDAIGTSTLWAAWNAAVYVAQIDDGRLSAALADRAYLDATQAVTARAWRLVVLNLRAGVAGNGRARLIGTVRDERADLCRPCRHRDTPRKTG